jgi:phosphoesterase RecJ-like protein
VSEADRIRVEEALDAARDVVVAMHLLPDGDTTGSALGLADILRHRGHRVAVVCPDPVMAPFRFLPGWDAVRIGAGAADVRGDVVVTVDCGDDARCFGRAGLRRFAPCIVNIDHHRSNPRFGDVNWIEPSRPAVGDMLVHLADCAGWDITAAAALCWYVSIVSDTEGLRFGAHDGRLFEQAARLCRLGVDPDAVSRHLWESRRLSAARLEGWVLSHIERLPSGRVAWVRVPWSVQESLGSTAEDAEGLVADLRGIEGVRLAMFLREDASGIVRMSLRSRPPFDAGALAAALGGGGHEHSAGAEWDGTVDSALQAVLELVAARYEETVPWTDL